MSPIYQLWQKRCSHAVLLQFAALSLSLAIVVSARTQDGRIPSEPESFSVLYYLDPSAKLTPLESQLVHRKQKLHSMGFTGGELMYSVEGPKSPMRLKAADKLNFVVRLKSRLDPVEAIQLYHVEITEVARVVPIDDFNALGRVSKMTVPALIDFNAAIYGTSSFKLVPIRTLAHGEYCFLIKAGSEWPKNVPGFCFGVDGP